MTRPASLFVSSLGLLSALVGPAIAQTVVYSNQTVLGGSSISAFAANTEWDDLQLVGGGLLSEFSLITRRSGGGPQFASGFFDLRLFNETGNFPQGESLGVIPFSGTFPATPAGTFADGILIGLTDLESLGIMLPTSGRIGVGVQFNQSGWGLIASGPATVGSSPGGNWLGTSPTERHEFGSGLPYRVAATDPVPVGPGVGNYSLFETALATPDHPTNNGGTIADAGFFSGIGFQVERTTHISQVGGYMSGNGMLFAAIVQTSSLFAVPSPPDLSGSNVLGTALIQLSSFDGADVAADLDVTLEPGTYALVFGSGKFGAVGGDGFLRDNHIPNGTWSEYSIRQSDGLRIFQAGTNRLFAIAKSAPGTVQVRPTFDLLAEVGESEEAGDVGSVRLIDGDASIIVDANTAPEPDRHAVFEFSLANVPLDREITKVTLELSLDLLTSSGPLLLDVLGFAGDGAAQRSDAIGPQTVVGQTNFVTGSVGDIVSINLDPAFLAGLLGQATHLGLTIAPEAAGNFRFETLESGEFGEPPLLTISLGPPSAPGDYNGDGTVDAADYTVWRDNVGAPEWTLPNDVDGGVIGQAQYDTWKANFGTSSGGAASGGNSFSNVAVPEPAAALLLMLATVGWGLQPRVGARRRSGATFPRR
jgi:hypothetical protein